MNRKQYPRLHFGSFSLLSVVLISVIVSMLLMCLWNSLAIAEDTEAIVSPQIDIFVGPGDQGWHGRIAAFDSINNRFLVAWTDGGVETAEIDLFGQLVNANGTLYGGLIAISTTIGSQLLDPQATFDSISGRFLVVWADNRNGPWNIYGQLVNTDGSLNAGNFPISPTPPVEYSAAGNPTVQFETTNGRFLVVWLACNGELVNICGQVVSPNGSLQGSVIQITDYADYYAAYPDIAVDPTNRHFLITWGNQLDGYVYGRLLNFDGTFDGSEITIGYYGLGYSYVPSLCFDPVNNRFLQLWTGMKGQLINADGTLYGTEINIFDPGMYTVDNPTVVFDTANNKFLVAGAIQYPYDGIVGQLLNPNGDLWGLDFPIFELIYDDREGHMGDYPPHAVSGSAETGALVVYMDVPHWSTSRYDIFGNLVKTETLDMVPITFPDPNLEAAIWEALGNSPPTGDLYPSDLARLTHLDASSRGIQNLSGLEYCTGLLELDLSDNQIGGALPSLSGLTSLTALGLYNNQINDISPLSSLTSLTEVRLDYNQITDISSLASLTDLVYIGLSVNHITNIGSLIANTGLGLDDYVGLESNPLNANSLGTCIPELQSRGVTVGYDPANTPAGSNVTVDFGDGSMVTFENVETLGTTIATPNPDPNLCDPNFAVLGGNCYDITTGATFTGSVLISLPYDQDQITVPEGKLKILHYEGGAWVNVTVSVDTVNNIITGQVTSLSPFVIVEPAATVEISVTLQGSSRPSPAGWEIPLTIKFFKPGANPLTDSPLGRFDRTAAKSGGVAICRVDEMKPGTYDVTVSGETTLLNVKRNVVVALSGASLNMGTLLEGDANGDGIIDISDFTLLAASFMKMKGDTGFNASADFDRNGIVDITDFTLLAGNFMKMSPVEVP